MKIMFLVGSYWPAQDGVSKVTSYIAEGLAKNHEVLVVAQRKPTMSESEEHGKVRIERIYVERNSRLGWMQGEKAKARKRVKQYGPDVLVIVGIQNWGYDWFKKDLDSYTGRKVLMTHGCSCLKEYDVIGKIKQIRIRRKILADLLDVYHEWYGLRYKRSLKKDMAKFDMVTYLYEEERLHCYSKEIGLVNDMILENATEDFFFGRKAYLIDNTKKIVFINVSNYEKRKNQRLILEAFCKADLPNAELDLIGSYDNEYVDELRDVRQTMLEMSRQKPTVNIWTGLTRQEVLNLYREADVYVCASTWEAMSISLCEAAAAGLTILSTDVGHAAKIAGVHLFQTKDELIELMRRVQSDRDLRARSGKEAYEFAEQNYRIQSKVDEFETALLKICGE